MAQALRVWALLLALHICSLDAQRVLVFSPHPDDDVLGCGGTIIKHVQQGDDVSIIYMTSGEMGVPGDAPKRERGRIREKEAREAAEMLRVHDVRFLRYPDGELSFKKRYVLQLTQILLSTQPDVIYIPHERDGHGDHQLTNTLVRAALEEAPCSPLIRCYEVWTPLENIDHLEDITEVFEQKMRALAAHVSQLAQIAYDRAIEGLNAYRACMQGAFWGLGSGHAEAFSEIKS